MKIDSAKPGEFYLVGTANGPQLFKVLELGYYPGARAGILFDGAKVRSTRVAFKKWWVK